MNSASSIVIGAIVALFGIIGLFMAANAVDAIFYGVGLTFFVFATLFDFWLVKKWFDVAEHRA